MVVLICSMIFVLILLIIFLIISSVIKLKLINFRIEKYEDLKQIIILIKNKEYVKIFDYLDFILKLQVCLLNKIPLFNFKVSDEGIEKFLRRQIRKNKLKKEEKEIEKFEKEDKKEIDEDIMKINLESLELLMNLGTKNASSTALLTTALTILISVILPFLTDDCNSINYKYEINPIYLDKPIFNIDASLVLSLPTIDAVKLIK